MWMRHRVRESIDEAERAAEDVLWPRFDMTLVGYLVRRLQKPLFWSTPGEAMHIEVMI
jgi:hypothetical protein